MNGKQLAGRRLHVEFSKDSATIEREKREGRRQFDPDRGRPPPDYGQAPRGREEGRASNGDGTVTNSLFVAQIPSQMDERDLEDHFAKYGKVRGVKMLPQKAETKVRLA